MKKIFILFLVLAFATSASATIYNVSTNENVMLGEKLIITGDYNTSNVLCSFQIRDFDGVTIERISDEYTFTNGSFYAERVINEPPYFRATDYNVVVICGNAQADATFTLTQRRGIDNFMFGEIFYFMDEGNMLIYFVFGLAIFVLMAGGAVIFLKQATFYKDI